MATNPNSMVQEAGDTAISKRGEIGLQVVAYVDGKQVVDVWDGLADITTGRQVDADTLFPVFSVTKAVTAVALHIQAERGLVDYAMPIAHYWPEFGDLADIATWNPTVAIADGAPCAMRESAADMDRRMRFLHRFGPGDHRIEIHELPVIKTEYPSRIGALSCAP